MTVVLQCFVCLETQAGTWSGRYGKNELWTKTGNEQPWMVVDLEELPNGR
jgi:hypothetical protein